MSDQQTGWQGSDGTWHSATMPQPPSGEQWGAPKERLVAAQSPVARPEFTIKPPARWSGLATASMVLGVLWLFWLGSVLAVIFGHIALARTARNPDVGGHSMAVVGVILGWLGIATLALLIVLKVA